MAVKNQSASILKALADFPKSQIEYGTEEIEYESSSGSLSGLEDEYREFRRLQKLPDFFLSSSSSGAAPQNWIDQHCAFGKRDNFSRILFFIEYKVPHELSTAYLKAGFENVLKETSDKNPETGTTTLAT